MGRRLPNKPTVELGTGAGLPAHLRPRAVTDPLSTLSKPFKIPFKTRSSAMTNTGKAVRSARLKGPKSYFVGSLEADGQENDVVAFDGSIIQRKKNALRRIATDDVVETTLKRSFTSPLTIKGHNHGTPPPPLGTKRKPVMVPRPLHDPSDETAIVLYDPTVEKIISDDDLEALDKAIALAKARDEGKEIVENELEKA